MTILPVIVMKSLPNCALSLVALVVGAAAEQPRPYRDLSARGTAFTDSVPPHVSLDTLTAVRLGVLAPLGDPDGAAMLDGARVAVLEANLRGGYRGLPYAIAPRTTEGPWGIAGRQVAALAYDDGVFAIIGGLDGGEAHLAELIAAKAWVPVVTPWASDLTIDYANVPWVFRVGPDDGTQARALWEYALRRGFSRILTATEGTREGRAALARLSDAVRERRHPPALAVEFDPNAPENIVPRILGARPEAIVLWGKPTGTLRLLRGLHIAGYVGPALAPGLLATPETLAAADSLGEVIIAAPYNLSRTAAEVDSFARSYRSLTGRELRPSAVMAYDVAHIVIAAVERGGLNRASIRRAIAEGAFAGLSGNYTFTTLGGTKRAPVLLSVRGGRWTTVKSPGGQE